MGTDQQRSSQRIANALHPVAACCLRSVLRQSCEKDGMTGLGSRSLGATEYRRQLLALGLAVASEYDSESRNLYFDAFKPVPADKLQPCGFAEVGGHAL
jgi:hypothetical protein